MSGLLSVLERHRGGSAIIYCGSRKATEEMAHTLSERGFRAEAYHAGLEAEDRRKIQDRFIRDRTPIVTATIAFGMGINKPDVRLVVHHDLPKSIESYYQETGRAGRDGLPSECVLYFSYGGKSRQEFFINQIDDDAERERARERLDQVMSLCSLSSCRRKFVLEYLGEEWVDEDCGGCDNCLQPREQYDATEIAQKVLSAVIRTGERFGAAHVIGVLRGSRGERILKQGHDQLSVYGIAPSYSQNELRDLVEDLKREGLVSVGEGEYPTLAVTPRGREFLKNRETLMLSRRVAREERAETRGGRIRGDDAAYDAGLYNELAALRRAIADERGVPAYVIFNNRTLQDMARKIPRNAGEFARVSGVGRAKLEDLGEAFLDCINAYLREHGMPEASDSVRQAVAARPSHRVVHQSFRETGRIISEGASLEEAAAAKGIKVETVVGHLERLVENGIRVRLSNILPPPERKSEIESVFEAVGDELLRPVFDELDGEFSYIEIRLTRLERRQKTLPQTSNTLSLEQQRTAFTPSRKLSDEEWDMISLSLDEERQREWDALHPITYQDCLQDPGLFEDYYNQPSHILADDDTAPP